jgi:hypothetical protein
MSRVCVDHVSAFAVILLQAMSSAPRGQRVRFWSDVALRRGGQELRTARDKMRLRFNVRALTCIPSHS